MISMEPKGSMLSIFVLRGNERYVSDRLGTLRNIARPTRTAPPMGRFLVRNCKFYVHENRPAQFQRRKKNR